MQTPEEWAESAIAKSWADPQKLGTVSADEMKKLLIAVFSIGALSAAPRWIPVGERLPAYQDGAENVYPVTYPSFLNGQPTIGAAEITRDHEWSDPAHGIPMSWCDLITHWLDVTPAE